MLSKASYDQQRLIKLPVQRLFDYIFCLIFQIHTFVVLVIFFASVQLCLLLLLFFLGWWITSSRDSDQILVPVNALDPASVRFLNSTRSKLQSSSQTQGRHSSTDSTQTSSVSSEPSITHTLRARIHTRSTRSAGDVFCPSTLPS